MLVWCAWTGWAGDIHQFIVLCNKLPILMYISTSPRGVTENLLWIIIIKDTTAKGSDYGEKGGGRGQGRSLCVLKPLLVFIFCLSVSISSDMPKEIPSGYMYLLQAWISPNKVSWTLLLSHSDCLWFYFQPHWIMAIFYCLTSIGHYSEYRSDALTNWATEVQTYKAEDRWYMSVDSLIFRLDLPLLCMMNCIEYQNGCSPSELGIRNHFAYATEELNNFRLLLTKMTVVQSSAPIPELQWLSW